MERLDTGYDTVCVLCYCSRSQKKKNRLSRLFYGYIQWMWKVVGKMLKKIIIILCTMVDFNIVQCSMLKCSYSYSILSIFSIQHTLDFHKDFISFCFCLSWISWMLLFYICIHYYVHKNGYVLNVRPHINYTHIFHCDRTSWSPFVHVRHMSVAVYVCMDILGAWLHLNISTNLSDSVSYQSETFLWNLSPSIHPRIWDCERLFLKVLIIIQLYDMMHHGTHIWR